MTVLGGGLSAVRSSDVICHGWNSAVTNVRWITVAFGLPVDTSITRVGHTLTKNLITKGFVSKQKIYSGNRHKQEAVQRHCGCDVPPDQSLGEHGPLWRMENMNPQVRIENMTPPPCGE